MAVRLGRVRLRADAQALAVVLAFLTLYGLLSAQYLLWAVPLGLARPGRAAAFYTAAATAGLVGFYLFLAPGVLLPGALDRGCARAGRAAVGGRGSRDPSRLRGVALRGAAGRRERLARGDRREVTAVHLALAVTHDLERRDEPQDLAGLEEVLRARRPSPRARVLPREGLAEEDTARGERTHDRREERPVQVVEHEHQLVLTLAEADPRDLEVEHVGNDRQVQPSRDRPQRLDARGVAVERAHEGARRREDEGVAPAAARHVERARAARDEADVLEEPRRRTGRRHRLVVERARPGRHPADEVVDARHAGLGEERGGAARAQAVVADDEDRPAVFRDDRRGGGEPVHRQEERARHVALGGERGRRAHVEDAGRRGDELERLLLTHVLVAPGAREYSGGQW